MIPNHISKADSKKPKILIAVPTANITGYVAGRLFDFLNAAKRSIKYDVDILRIEQSPVDLARNFIVDTFLNTDYDYLMMVDDDTVPPMIALDMVEQGRPFMAGVTYIFQTGELVLNAFTVPDPTKKGVVPLRGVEFTGLQEVDSVGTACVLIRRDVFSQIERPFFSTELSFDKASKLQGEDLYFCEKLKKAGIPVVVDTNVICGHMKMVDLASMALRRKKEVDRLLDEINSLKKQVEAKK